MPQKIIQGYKQLMAKAEAEVDSAGGAVESLPPARK